MKLGDPQEIGKLMRERRLALGFTQLEFAQATGVSPITIMRIELGRVSYIHARTAKALEVPKKIVRRMVLEPVAVMADGSRSVPKAPSISYSGDNEALPATKRYSPQKAGVSHTMSPLKKTLLWLASKI